MYQVGLGIKTKYERLALLESYGVNTLDYHLIRRGTSSAAIDAVISGLSRVSIRTQDPSGGLDVSYPKLINVDRSVAISEIYRLANNYDILVSSAIDPQFATKCGNIALLPDNSIVVEVVFGPGTLDRLTRQGQVDACWETTHARYRKDIDDEQIRMVIDEVQTLPFLGVIIEFSCFRFNVGRKAKPYIAWEITNW